MEVSFRLEGPRGENRAKAEALAAALAVAGVAVAYDEDKKTSSLGKGWECGCVTFCVDEKELSSRCVRNAGAKRRGIPSGSIVEGMDELELAAWTLSATIDEVCKALGVSASTAYSRKRDARKTLGLDA